MLRVTTVLVAASVLVSACGGPNPVGSAKREAATSCPEGTAPLHAADIIGTPPPGFEVVEGDRKVLGSIADQFKAQLEGAWRGYDAKILVRRGALNGTAVMVVNTSERAVPEHVVAGAEAGGRQHGQTVHPITIGGVEGRISRNSDGAYVAAAATGTCSLVYLFADTEPRVRRTAAAIPPS